MKYLLFLLLFALNFGQTWNTITTDYSTTTYRNNFKLHKLGNDLIHLAYLGGSGYYKFDGSNFDLVNTEDYQQTPGRLISNNSVFMLGSVYNTLVSNNRIWSWHISSETISGTSRRRQYIGVFNNDYTLVDEIPDNNIDNYYPFSDTQIISGDSIIISGLTLNTPYTSSFLTAKLLDGELDFSTYGWQDGGLSGGIYTLFPIYQLFNQLGENYCITGTRKYVVADINQSYIDDGITLWENTGSLSEWEIVKQWDKVQYAQFVCNINERIYFVLDSDSAGSTNKGIWKFYRGVTKKIPVPFADPLIISGMYAYNENLFVAVTNGINTDEDYIYHYYMGKWHPERYKLPFSCTEMLYDGSRFWAKYTITRQKTYPNTSGGNYLPRYTTDIPIYNDKVNYFIGIK